MFIVNKVHDDGRTSQP